MTWLIIVVIMVAAFAPVAYMMPSKRDKALANIRMIARREGLEVDVTQLPKVDAQPHERVSAGGIAREALMECVSYGLRLPKTEGQAARYRLLRNTATEWPVLPAVSWELDGNFKAASFDHAAAGDAYWAILSDIDSLLPDDQLALAVTDDFALFYWRERFGGETADVAAIVTNIRQALNKLADHHQRFFAVVPPEAAPE